MNALSCAGFAREVKVAIGSQVVALQRLEHEASDRLKGLDSRPFEFLRGEAGKAAAVIADPAALRDEEELKRCRNATRPIRRLCADAAQGFVTILEKHVAAEKPGTAEKPDYDKPQYAAAIAECERLLGLKPLKSRIRGND